MVFGTEVGIVGPGPGSWLSGKRNVVRSAGENLLHDRMNLRLATEAERSRAQRGRPREQIINSLRIYESSQVEIPRKSMSIPWKRKGRVTLSYPNEGMERLK